MTEPYIHPSLGRRKTMRRTPLKRSAMKQKAPKDPGIPKHTREFVLRRDGGCVLREHEHPCFGGLQIHHILPRSRGGQHSPNNLLTACSFHHLGTIHGNPAWAKENGYLR